MQAKTFINALLALLPAAQAYKFTEPDPSIPLDVSGTITIGWTQNSSSAQKIWPELDLEWFSQPDRLHKFWWDISRNHSASAGQYAWKPGKNTLEVLAPFHQELRENKLFSFIATLHDGDEMGPVFSSDNYTIVWRS